MNARTPTLIAVVTACLLFTERAVAQSEVLDLHGPSIWEEGSQYGFSVDLDGDAMAIGQYQGAFDWASGNTAPGMVHVFRRQPFGWISDGTVQASDGEEGDYFGWSVALEGDRLLVGAVAIGYLSAKGAVYVFERQGDGMWVETAKLLPDEPQAFAIGWSVDLEGNTAVIGAKGASIGLGWGRIYVYELVGGTWSLQQEILPSVSKAGDGFGVSLDLQGDRLVVGASYLWQPNPPNSGFAFVFERQSGVWIQTALLIGGDTDNYDLFGTGVALEGETILVGATGYDVPGGANGGAVYAFDLIADAWTQTASIPGPAADLSNFGSSIDLEGGLAVIGAPKEPVYGPYSGSAYLFERSGAIWKEISKFGGSDVGETDTFGYSVDLEGKEIFIGAPRAVSGSDPGAAYLFSLEPGPHLLADAGLISLSQGGEQAFSLGAGPVHAGDLFFLAGSATGTAPGFVFAGLPVPLNPDVYFLYTVNHPGMPPLAGSFGSFDAFGTAEASFALPPGFASAFAGLVLNHAYAVLDAVTLQLEAVSPAVGVELVP